MTTDKKRGTALARLAFNLLGMMVCSALVWSVLDLSLPAGGLSSAVEARRELSGVASPITAVLLNFRGYDTLLEVCVLLLASIGCLTIRESLSTASRRPSGLVINSVLDAMIHHLVPLMILMAGYLVCAGEHAPGGAFQGGAVLAAAVILLLLGNRIHPPEAPGWPLRMSLALALGVFLLLAGGMTWGGGSLLEYPRAWAAEMIILLETVLAFSIAVVLITLFAVSPPAGCPASNMPASRSGADVEERQR